MVSLVKTLLTFDLTLAVILALFILHQKNIVQAHKTLFLSYVFGAIVWISGVLGMFYFPTEILYTDQDKLVYFFSKMAFWGPLIFFPAELWFIKTYPEKKIKLGSYFNLFPLGIALSLVFINFFDNTIFISFFIRDGGYVEGTLGPFQGLYSLFIITYYIYSSSLLLIKMKRAKNLILKKQFQYLFYSFLFFGALGLTTNWILPAFMHTPYLSGLGPLTFVFVIIFFLYSVTNYRFLDIKFSLQRTLTYVTNTSLYLFLFYGFFRAFNTQIITQEMFLFLLSGTFLATVFIWKDTLSSFDKLFNYFLYRKEKNPIQQIQESLYGFKISMDKGLRQLAQALQVNHAQFEFASNGINGNPKNQAEFSLFIKYFSKNPQKELVKEELKYELVNLKKNSNKKQKKQLKTIMEKYMVSAAIPVLNEDKKLLGVLFLEHATDEKLFSSQEIQEIKRLLKEATIYLAKEKNHHAIKSKLKDSKQVKKEFIDGLLHEIRTPLTVASSMKDLIDWKKLKPEDQRFLDTAQGSIFEVSKKLEKVSEAFRWQHHLFPLERIDTCLEDIFRVALENLQESYPNIFEQSHLKVKPKSLATKKINVDFYQLKRAFYEIIKNGLFFNIQKNKRVEIRVSQEKENFVIDFIDNGVGVEKKKWEDIFELLHVLAFSRNRSECGIGTGLTFSRGIIESHGGSIKVIESQEGRGTTFRVTFPLEAKGD